MKHIITAALAVIVSFTCVSLGQGQGVLGKEETWVVQSMTDRVEFVLADRRRLCLSGVWVRGFELASPNSSDLRQALLDVVHDHPMRLSPGEPTYVNRYSCEVALVETEDGFLQQEDLLKRGLAIVRPMSSSRTDEDIDIWLAIEEKARRAQPVIWSMPTSHPKAAATVSDQVGKAVLVEGRGGRVSSNDGYANLNFGRDWQTDFTVRVRQRLIGESGLEPDGFKGKIVRVRGFVQESRGPLIDITHLKQIEIIP